MQPFTMVIVTFLIMWVNLAFYERVLYTQKKITFYQNTQCLKERESETSKFVSLCFPWNPENSLKKISHGSITTGLLPIK